MSQQSEELGLIDFPELAAIRKKRANWSPIADGQDTDNLLKWFDQARVGLKLIADQTCSPELFPNDDGDKLCVKTAMTIALAILEGPAEE